MKSCTVIVKIEPPVIETDEVEDFLATDDLFVEYFNAFLSLPSFPEPLCFNKETGGFEVVSEAKKTLAQQIKMAMRSQKRMPKIYRPVKNHAYRDIPLIPLVPPKGPEKIEIDTTFSVTTLNKEQGIHWIKEERLPAFLNSDTYLEYRLGKIVSQARVSGPHGEVAMLRIDYRPRAKKSKKKEEEPPPDPIEVLKEQLYVCMGNTGTTESEQWYARAQQAHETHLTFATLSPRPTIRSPSPATRVSALPPTPHTPSPSPHAQSIHPSISLPLSAEPPLPGSRYASLYQPPSAPLTQPSSARALPPSQAARMSATSARPQSADSRLEKIRRPDSAARATPMKSSVFASPYFGCYVPGIGPAITDLESPPLSSRLFARESSEIPSNVFGDSLCISVDDEVMDHGSCVVYQYPHVTPSISSCSCPEEPEDVYPTIHSSADTMLGAQGKEGDVREGALLSHEGEEIVLRSVDDMGAVIVGAVLKRTVADVTQCDEKTLEDHPQIAKIFPHHGRYNHVTVEMLHNVVLDPKFSTTPPYLEPEPLPDDSKLYPPFDKEEVKEESDQDSLLDSDEDYEEGDEFFRKDKKPHRYTLSTRRGIEEFKKFLKGTQGERFWNLWIDIDRSHTLCRDDKASYLQTMREKYFSQGSVYEIPVETKKKLGLNAPSKWTVERLLAVQNKVAEPLVLYWAPRFLLRQQLGIDPTRNKMYVHQQLLRRPKAAFECPPNAPLLPLRPKSCRPRLQTTGPAVIKPDFARGAETGRQDPPVTSPRVGYRRRHLPEVVPPTPRTQAAIDARAAAKKPPPPSRKPREFLCSKIVGQLTRTAKAKDAEDVSPVRPPSHSPTPSVSDSEAGSSDYGSAADGDLPSPSRHQSGPPPPESSRPSSAALSTASSGIDSEHSEFCGGERMEALLRALDNERSSGGFFKTFVEKSKNTYWTHALQFWTDLQDYHKLFYKESVDPYALDKKAQYLYSQYIVESAPRDIQCEKSVKVIIYRNLIPPFEDLFDSAEEHCLNVLYDAWVNCLGLDLQTYNKVELIEVKRHLETKSKYVLHLQRRGIIKERAATPETPQEGTADPVYDESILEQVDPEFREYTLEKLVHNRVELEHFRQFLADKYAGTDLLCWMDMEAWRRIPPSEERRRDQKAKEIKVKYLNKKYFFGPNSPAGREGQNQVMAASGGWGRLLEDKPSSVVLLEAQKYVRQRLEKKWLPLFLATSEFVARQRPRASMDDVVDDVMVQKRRRSQAVWKLLESRWVTSSKEIITFRKALLNPVTCLQFQRFVSIKGDSFENDVLFWIEVQRYKNLYHAHSDDSTINQKIWAIINCFIDSNIPPALQIDIPQEMADRIMDRKHERGPYLFREAQLTVFRVLFPHWNEFCHFRQNLAEDSVLPTIERQRRRTKAQQRKRLLEQEDRMAREQAEREAAALEMEDPFKDTDYIVEDDDDLEDERDKISFSYSTYMDGLNQEDMMNNSNESMFSSLLGGSQEIPVQDVMSVVSVNAKEDQNTNNSNKRKNSRAESVQADKSQSLSRKDSSSSSGVDKTALAAPTSTLSRKGSAKGSRAPTPTDMQPAPPKPSVKVEAPPQRNPPKSPGVGGGAQRSRLSRNMPPLVQKRPS